MSVRLKYLETEDFSFEPSYKLAYWLWGDRSNDPVYCVHGLTRNGRDFDYLAKSLADQYLVNCPDLPGRGKSDWLSDTGKYNYDTYTSCILKLMDSKEHTNVHWVGTSLGGILGMRIAAEYPERIRKLVLNDVGAVIPVTGMKRINDYVGMAMQFSDRESAEQNLRKIHAGFGIKEDAHWQHLLDNSFNKLSNGEYQLSYDPGILDPVRNKGKQLTMEEDLPLWGWWDKIECPILVIRGESSDILSADLAQEMLNRNSNAELVTLPGIGHAPSLMEDSQINLVRGWLSNAEKSAKPDNQ